MDNNPQSPSRLALAARIAKYAYQPSTVSLPIRTRRSIRNEDDGVRDQDEIRKVDDKQSPPRAGPSRWSSSVTPSKRRSTQSAGCDEKDDDDGSPLMKKLKADAEVKGQGKGKGKGKGKVPRGYAPPEVYAHLKNTPDHLMVGLRGMSRYPSLCLCMCMCMCERRNA